ncbi:sirohydrochlorin chelatase [Kineococcus sp. SYSU DK006]|uniref:sirohydrochlorin chelatase n=1 Tax=Kineococcus sp. SYSU DK006 TaxID=3383127 RepID=UPI003D7E3881
MSAPLASAPPVQAPVLVACSHGTRSELGRRTVDALRDAVAAARPDLSVRAAHVDVHGPELPEVVGELSAAGRRSVVVPLLLSSGYHVRVDVARAVAASGGLATAAEALGPGSEVTGVVLQRLGEALGEDPAAFEGAVVLAAAGSSDAVAQGDVRTAAALLGERLRAPVTCGFLSAQEPTVADAVAAARRAGARRVAVAGYLLAPGVFSRRLAAAGADAVAEPMGPHPALVDLVVRRYEAAAALAATP